MGSMPESTTTVAFIGLGVMGFHMAVNLRKKMNPQRVLVVADISQDAIARFQERVKEYGPVTVVQNGFEAAKLADTIFTVLPSNNACRAVYLDPQTGVLAGTKTHSYGQEKTIIECGTIGQSLIYEIRDEAAKISNLSFVDAPVSGGPSGAEAGTLTIMVGGTREKFDYVKPYLQMMGKEVNRFGEVGTGTAFKTINNYIYIISVLTASEALNIGAKMGLDMKHLVDTINISSGQNWTISNNNPVPGIHSKGPASNDFKAGFRIELAQKDLTLGQDLADLVGARGILSKATLDAMAECTQDPRNQGKDVRVLYRWLQEQGSSSDSSL